MLSDIINEINRRLLEIQTAKKEVTDSVALHALTAQSDELEDLKDWIEEQLGH